MLTTEQWNAIKWELADCQYALATTDYDDESYFLREIELANIETLHDYILEETGS